MKTEKLNCKQNQNPMLKSAALMSRICGIGENKLRELMDAGELEFLQIGNRRLLADQAIWYFYARHKTVVRIRGVQVARAGVRCSTSSFMQLSPLKPWVFSPHGKSRKTEPWVYQQKQAFSKLLRDT